MAILGQYGALYAGLSVDEARARHTALGGFTTRVLDALDAPDAGWHLDIGCGDGLVALALARRRPAMHILGLDGAPAALALATKLAQEEGLRGVRFIEGDAEAPPDARFTRLSATSLFNLMPDKQAALAAWRRVAEPGARLVLTDAFDARGPGTLGAGATSLGTLTLAASRARWRIVRREDVTPVVRALHARKAWTWPEYVREGFRYAIVSLEAV